MKTEGVSVIICCHNGARRLPETIAHIARQAVPSGFPWELLLVDNGSTDLTAEVTLASWRDHGAPTTLRIVREPLLGLSYARATGFRHAQYEYMLLCDDDNWLAENYVRTAWHIMERERSIGALGGLGTLCFETEPAVAELSYVFAAGPQASRSGKADDNKVYGAGCVVRHTAYQKLLRSGFRSLLTDRRGLELSSGGDHELCLALAVLGYDIWYDERLRFTHFITSERLTWDYFVRYAHESSRRFNVISSYKMVVSDAPLSRRPLVAVLRNFLVCLKIFVEVNLRRLSEPRYKAKALYFKHLVFRYKLTVYLSKFRELVNTHRAILEFRRNCRPPQHILKPAPKPYTPLFRLSFFSKPSRQLP